MLWESITGGIILAFIIAWGYRSYRRATRFRKGEVLSRNGGISVVKELKIGGIKQYILIEGQDRTAPACLFLHGGPGSPFPFGVSSRSLYLEITRCCVAVYYDQRGAGKSYHKDIDPQTMNIEQFIADANEVVDYVRNLLNQEKLFLVGNSFGTIIGTELAHRFPEKFHAYIGLGQVANIIEGQHLAYVWLLKQAEANQDAKMVRMLRELGGAPYFGEREEKLGDFLNKSTGNNYKDENTEPASIFGMIKGAFTSPDYSISDIYKTIVSGAKFSILECKNLQEEIIKTNFFATISEIKIPVYFYQGKYDLMTNFEVARKYFDQLIAPEGKEFIVLENSAHYPNKQDFTAFLNGLAMIITKRNNHEK